MTTTAPPAGRYGPTGTSGRRRRNVTVLAVLGAALVAGVSWLALGGHSQDVSYETYGYKKLSAEQVTVTFDVTAPKGSTVECTVDALNEGHAQIGTHDFRLGPSSAAQTRYTVTLQTSEPAVSGTVDACRLVD